LEHLSDASYLGKLLVLPANVRLGWKVIARYKHSNLFGLIVSNKETSFIKSPKGTVGLANFRATCDENPQMRTSINEYFEDDLQSGKVSLLRTSGSS
jgi:hypothetical protein